MTNKCPKFDLGNRTATFSEAVISQIRQLSNSTVNGPLILQLIRSATSIGANYMEADGAESKKDFEHKISISKKEAKETYYWLRLLSSANPDHKARLRPLLQECHEIVLIFSAILNSSRNPHRSISHLSIGH